WFECQGLLCYAKTERFADGFPQSLGYLHSFFAEKGALQNLHFATRPFPLPEQFWSLHDDLLRLLKKPMSRELEAEVENTLNRFRAAFFSPGVQSPEEIRAEFSEV
ncbi:MAG: hypothetical protein IJ112_04145, partial [Oscillospiraceae bacterium]|nr:hypothetical protein [Oscillospiraceae bacterium]